MGTAQKHFAYAHNIRNVIPVTSKQASWLVVSCTWSTCYKSQSVSWRRWLGLIHKTIKHKYSFLSISQSMVRPHLKYCSASWSPFPQGDLKKLPYKERLNRLGLWSLEERRNKADLDLSDLIELFKMVNSVSPVFWTQFFSRPTITNKTRGHSCKLKKVAH